MFKWFVIRADANTEIGIGHVMRCLALAEWLRDAKIRPLLLTKHNNDLVKTKLKKLNGKVVCLPISSNPSSSIYAHSKWLKGSEEEDAILCATAILQEINNTQTKPLFILVDHYALGAPWESKVAHLAPILAIDDLSDRQHECHWLVDQTIGKYSADYEHLVPEHATLMIGPDYALIRKEFSQRSIDLSRETLRSTINVLVSLGGIDKDNYSLQILSYLDNYEGAKDLQITVVTSKLNPNLQLLQEVEAGYKKFSLLVDVNNMAEIMAVNDVCIGAAGSTSWERCVMSLPTLSIIIANNQVEIAHNLAKAGATYNLGLAEEMSESTFLNSFVELISSNNSYFSLSRTSNLLCDGLGCERIIKQVVNTDA